MKANHNSKISAPLKKRLEQISASQRMKANHNLFQYISGHSKVGTNISKSKNESKSQRLTRTDEQSRRWNKYQQVKE